MRTQLTRLVAMLVLALMMSATGAFAAHGERHGEGGRIVGEGLRGDAGGRGFGNGCGGGSG
jgi:hypothetical protein